MCWLFAGWIKERSGRKRKNQLNGQTSLRKDLNLVSFDMCKVKKQTLAGWLNQGGKSVPRFICFSAKLAPSSGIVLLYEEID